MRSHLRRLTQFVSFFAISLAGATLFQNCGSYQAVDNPLYDMASESVCVGLSCSTDISAVQLRVANQEPLIVGAANTGSYDGCGANQCLDIAGYCDTAGFTQNYIYYELQGPTPIALTRSNSTCDAQGRFRLRVPLPGGYQASSLHTLVVTLTVVDENGQEQTNPSGLNRNQISVIAEQ